MPGSARVSRVGDDVCTLLADCYLETTRQAGCTALPREDRQTTNPVVRNFWFDVIRFPRTRP